MLRKKLKSKNGVSVLMALFLFLACAVVGSVVLTSATAAAGRRVQLDISDQRYYSVDSAAGVIRDAITKKSITVMRECSTTTHKTYDLLQDEFGVSKKTGTHSTVYDPVFRTYLPDAGEDLADVTGNDLLYFAAANLIPGLTTDGMGGFFSDIVGTGDAKKNFSISVPYLAEGLDTSFMKVDCVMKVGENGDLIFTFRSDGFSVTEVFGLVFGETSTHSTAESTHVVNPVPGKSKQFTETFDITETDQKKGTFRWEFVSCDIK